MQKIMTFSVNDFACNSEDIENRINKACLHSNETYTVTSVCQFDDEVYIILLPETEKLPLSYHLQPLTDLTTKSVISNIEQRWEAGFNTIASINIGDSVTYMLYARIQSKK